MLRDLGYAWRQLRHSPGFAATVALTLALSVGVATAVFCVIDAVILRPLPYSHPDRIVDIESRSGSGYQQPASWPSFKDERAQATAFDALAAYSTYQKSTIEIPDSGPVSLDTVSASDNFFQVFGVAPLLGRTFLPGEEEQGRNDVVVLGYGAWQKYFHGDRSVLDRALRLNGQTYTVIGVMPAGFRFPLNLQDALYRPMPLDAAWMSVRGNHWLLTIARLKDGASLARAQADLSHVFANIAKAYPKTDGGRTVTLMPLAQAVTAHARGPLWTLLGAVLAVLAIGCVNVAGLLMTRGVKREREMAVRTAVGAGRTRLARQLLVEGFLFAGLGALGGVLVASLVLDGMRFFLVKALQRGADIRMNWIVLAVAIGAAVVVSLLASLLPALRLSRLDPNRALKAGQNTGASKAQHRLRSGLVVTQVALTLVLLVVAGLLLRVVWRYRHSDLGFDPAHILAVQIDLSREHYLNRDMLSNFYRPLEERIRQLPGVKAAGFINLLPIAGWGSNAEVHIAGQPPYPANEERLTENRIVSTGYFDVFGIPLRSGRALAPALDVPDETAPTIVVNRAFVGKFIPNGLDPAAQRLDDDDKQENWTRIVGVMGDIRQDIYQPPLAESDRLMNEVSPKGRPDSFAHMYLVVRTVGDPMQQTGAIRSILHDLDPTVPFGEPRTMTQVVSQTLVFERLEGWLFGIFAGLALLLALVGLYGLVSHEVELTTRDIGLRMALGATRPSILGMVLRRVAWMLGVGAFAGLALTVAACKLIDIVIYFDAQKESGNLLLIAALLVAAGLLAALIPARRAASIDPMQALRAE